MNANISQNVYHSETMWNIITLRDSHSTKSRKYKRMPAGLSFNVAKRAHDLHSSAKKKMQKNPIQKEEVTKTRSFQRYDFRKLNIRM